MEVTVDFKWYRDSAGYTLVEASPPPPSLPGVPTSLLSHGASPRYFKREGEVKSVVMYNSVPLNTASHSTIIEKRNSSFQMIELASDHLTGCV